VARDPDDDEARLFRNAVQGAKPLATSMRAPARRRRPARARFARAEREAVLAESLTDVAHDADVETGEELSFRRPGVRDAVLRRLRRGQYRVDAELDLHGLVVADARVALRTFVAESAARGRRCVRVIHGKGLGSGQRGPVLTPAVNALLRRIATVVAFSSARPADGGTGALYVLLSRAD
jgi:DNA-nicking Smr family endonuclease